jgi:uncharacterized Ntn-hydrolase superfamily protein
MRAGKSAADSLRALVAVDAGEARRQVAMVDAEGRVAAHTGGGCVAAAGHRAGEGVSAQANMMERDTVWGAMVDGFDAAAGDLAERLVTALDAAEAEGGDVRGRQSAALLVVAGRSTGNPHRDVVVDLRVDDHPDPLAELRRLLGLRRAYDSLDEGIELAAQDDLAAALRRAE